MAPFNGDLETTGSGMRPESILQERTGQEKTGKERAGHETSSTAYDMRKICPMISDVLYQPLRWFDHITLDQIDAIESSRFYHGIMAEDILYSILAQDTDGCVLKNLGKNGFGIGSYYFVENKIVEVIMTTALDPCTGIVSFSIGSQTTRDPISCYTAYVAAIGKRPIERSKYNISMCEIKKSSLQINEKIGEGAFGEVKHAVYYKTPVALKIMKHNSKTKGKGHLMRAEGVAMKILSHRCIVRIHGGFFQDPDFYLVMEYMKSGSLNTYIKEHPTTDVGLRMSWFFDIASALAYVHRCGYMHRDVAARNCILDYDRCIVKLSDFGLAVKAKSYNLGSDEQVAIRWGAPEVLNEKRYVRNSDVWGFGLVMLEVIEDGREPFHEYNLSNVKDMLKNPNIQPKLKGLNWTLFLQRIVGMCLNHHPNRRPPMDYLCDQLACYARVYTTSDESKKRHQAAKMQEADHPCAENPVANKSPALPESKRRSKNNRSAEVVTSAETLQGGRSKEKLSNRKQNTKRDKKKKKTVSIRKRKNG